MRKRNPRRRGVADCDAIATGPNREFGPSACFLSIVSCLPLGGTGSFASIVDGLEAETPGQQDANSWPGGRWMVIEPGNGRPGFRVFR